MIRKSEADALPPYPAEQADLWKIVAHARTFYCSKGYDILNVDVTRYGDVVARYFADKVTGEFKGYLIGEPWSKIKLENLIQKVAGLRAVANTHSYYYSTHETAKWEWDDESRDVISDMFGINLTYWENSQESKRYYENVNRAWRRLQDRVHATLREVPEGFYKWAEETMREPLAIKAEMTGADGEWYRCTECGQLHTRKRKYKPNRMIECPHCGGKLRVRSEKDGKATGLYLIQTCKNNPGMWYERYIYAHKEWENGQWKLFMQDVALGIVGAFKKYGEVFYWAGDGYDWSRHNGRLPTFAEGYIYPDLGGAERIMTDQQERCLLALAAKGYKANANSVILHSKEPGMEYLIKGGYERFARDVIKRKFESAIGVNKEAEDISEYLGITRQRCFRLKRINGSFREWGWLKYEERTGKKVSADDMAFFAKHGIDCNETEYGTRRMLSFIPSPTAFRNYIEKQVKLTGETVNGVFALYDDYIQMAKKQGLNLSSEIFYKPKNLKAAHDECVRIAHEEEFEREAKKKESKFPGVPGILKEIKEKYAYASGEYAIVVPENIADILAEGRALGHCIDTTDRYFERIEKHVTYLVFLRRVSELSMSWYTLEIEPGGTIRQQRTTGNRQNKEDVGAYMPFIKEWQGVIRQRISDEDRKMAERSREIRKEEYRQLREKKETVRHGLLAGKLLVDVLEGDLVEAI